MNLININNTKEYLTKNEFYSVISDLKQSMLDGFDRVFQVMDENKTELKTEFKKDIGDLRLEMNQRFYEVDQRFISIDKRLLKIENDMIHKYEFEPLVNRVRLLEA